MANASNSQNFVNPQMNSLVEIASEARKGDLPPLEDWNPPLSGEIDIRIARDGRWFHEGGLIARPELVRLFSRILRREGEAYFLVTPVEKWRISVDDAPFVAVDFETTGQGDKQVLTFTTNVGDAVVAGPNAPLRVHTDPATKEPAPYVHVRAGLEALIDRKSFYRMMEIGTHHRVKDTDWFGIWSGGVFFPFVRSSEMG